VESWESKMAEDVGRLDSLHASLTQVQTQTKHRYVCIYISIYMYTMNRWDDDPIQGPPAIGDQFAPSSLTSPC
jgi:hypothetical protein